MYILLIILYFLLGLLYIILSGVDLPSQIDNWLHHHHNITYMIIGTIYVVIGCVYLVGKKYQKDESYLTYPSHADTEEDTNTTNNTANTTNVLIISVVTIIVLFLIYCWIMLLKQEKMIGSNNGQKMKTIKNKVKKIV